MCPADYSDSQCRNCALCFHNPLQYELAVEHQREEEAKYALPDDELPF